MAGKGTRYKEEQIIRILKEVENGTTDAEVCRQYGVAEQTPSEKDCGAASAGHRCFEGADGKKW